MPQSRSTQKRGLISKVLLLLLVIYLVDISLGLPDSLLGSGWPDMHLDLNVPASYAGFITMIIAANTIISSMLSTRMTLKFGAGVVTFISILLTAIAMLGFSLSDQFFMLCLWAIPYGLGAGAIDAATNNFVALHYNSRQLNWLNSFWGVGTIISPAIMGESLSTSGGWHLGYVIVGSIQLTIAVIVFCSLPLWRQTEAHHRKIAGEPKLISNRQMTKVPGMWAAILAFFAYSTIEQTTGLWASTFLVQTHDLDVVTVAKAGSLFYIGITVGRFIAGIISNRVGDYWLTSVGYSIIAIGIVMLLLPHTGYAFAMVGLVIVGLGCAPIWPAILHSTPTNFGIEHSQTAMGIQMAAAYTGTTTMPPVFGWLAGMVGMKLFPIFLLLFLLICALATKRLKTLVSRDHQGL